MYDAKRRRCLPRVVEMRFLVSVLEVIGMMATSVGVFSPTVGGGAVKCEDYRQGPLVFAKVIVCVSWVLLVFDIVFRVIAVDPLGCFSLSLLDELEDLGALATDTDEEGFLVPGKLGEAVERYIGIYVCGVCMRKGGRVGLIISSPQLSDRFSSNHNIFLVLFHYYT